MISDVSAVVSDFLYSEKPLAIVSVGRTPTEVLAAVPAARAAYVLRQDLTNLEEVCTDLLWRDPLSDMRRQTKIYYLGAFDEEHYADAFLLAARGVIDRAGAAPPPSHGRPGRTTPAQRPPRRGRLADSQLRIEHGDHSRWFRQRNGRRRRPPVLLR